MQIGTLSLSSVQRAGGYLLGTSTILREHSATGRAARALVPSGQSCQRMTLLLAPLASLLLARTALAGQCMVSGDYPSQAYRLSTSTWVFFRHQVIAWQPALSTGNGTMIGSFILITLRFLVFFCHTIESSKIQLETVASVKSILWRKLIMAMFYFFTITINTMMFIMIMFRGCDNVNACWDEAACCDRWGEAIFIEFEMI